MLRSRNVPLPLAAVCATLGLVLVPAGAARAQEPPPVYQNQKSKAGFHLDALFRQEWTENEGVTFLDTSRYILRGKPRLELGAKWFQLGVGGDFTYSNNDNLAAPPGETVPLMRDNFVSRDGRLDLAWGKITPIKYVSAEGGRFPMPVRFTEMIWDRDLRPQGASASLDFTSSGTGGLKHFGLTGVWARGSHVLPQEGAFQFSNRDTVWIGSATMSFSAGAQDTVELVGSFLKFDDLRFVDPRLRRQNTRVGGVLTQDYGVVDLVLRYHGRGHVNTLVVGDYCWNTAVSDNNKGIWAAMVLGSTDTARGSLEYTFAALDKDATLAAYTTDDFIWGTGWVGHRVDLGFRVNDHASSHVVGQYQKFKDGPTPQDRENWVGRVRLEVRYTY